MPETAHTGSNPGPLHWLPLPGHTRRHPLTCSGLCCKVPVSEKLPTTLFNTAHAPPHHARPLTPPPCCQSVSHLGHLCVLVAYNSLLLRECGLTEQRPWCYYCFCSLLSPRPWSSAWQTQGLAHTC